MLWLNLLAIALAYLIGSINPAYIIGRLKGFDIRKRGSKNAGAMNAFHVIGIWAGVITLVFDMAKGVLAMLLASMLLKINLLGFSVSQVISLPLTVYIAGFAAIAGHNWPFYLRFRGGKGAATTYGILILLMYLVIKQASATIPIGLALKQPFIIALFLFVFFTASFLTITKAPNLTSFVFIPLLVVIINYFQFGQISIAITIMCIYLVIVCIINIMQKGEGALKKEIAFVKRKYKIKIWRKLLRIAAVIFPLTYFLFAKRTVLILLTAFALLFIVLDIWKMRKGKKLLLIYKTEEKGLSNISLFLIGAFFTVLFFPREIAITALFFLIFGDITAEILGIKFGKIKLAGNKTLEGSLGCLASCLATGLILMFFINLSLIIIIGGSIAATFIELMPLRIGRFKIDDNLSMALFTALVMKILTLLTF